MEEEVEQELTDLELMYEQGLSGALYFNELTALGNREMSEEQESRYSDLVKRTLQKGFQ